LTFTIILAAHTEQQHDINQLIHFYLVNTKNHPPASKPIPFTLRPVEAVILSLLEENQRMTRRQIIDALCRHRSRKPLRSGSISYLPRLVRAGLVVEHRTVWNKRATKAYSLAENLSTRTRTRRDDGIDMMIKAMTRK
jgi:hypothetical protein